MRRMTKLLPEELRRTIKVHRARVAESVGYWGYSAPALNNIDLELIKRIGTSPGVFLEIGANDGYTQSNTYLLERRYGWRGILIEPLPDLARWCRRIRSRSVCVESACTSPGSADTLVDIASLNLTSVVLGQQSKAEEERRLMNRTFDVVKVRAATISSVIDQCGESALDLISVDVEGAEIEVLSGLDFCRHTPGWLVVETKKFGEVKELCEDTMTYAGRLSHHDYLFRSKVSQRQSKTL